MECCIPSLHSSDVKLTSAGAQQPQPLLTDLLFVSQKFIQWKWTRCKNKMQITTTEFVSQKLQPRTSCTKQIADLLSLLPVRLLSTHDRLQRPRCLQADSLEETHTNTQRTHEECRHWPPVWLVSTTWNLSYNTVYSSGWHKHWRQCNISVTTNTLQAPVKHGFHGNVCVALVPELSHTAHSWCYNVTCMPVLSVLIKSSHPLS